MIYISQYQFMRDISLMIMKYVKSILDHCEMFSFGNFFLKLQRSIYVLELMELVIVSHICYMLFLKKLQQNLDNQDRKYFEVFKPFFTGKGT